MYVHQRVTSLFSSEHFQHSDKGNHVLHQCNIAFERFSELELFWLNLIVLLFDVPYVLT